MILSLRGSSIKQLPMSFRNLFNLWFLDLTDCRSLEVGSLGVMSSLAKLQELYMGSSFMGWRDYFMQHEVVLELLFLCKLTTLEVDLPLVIDLDEYLQNGFKLFEMLEIFQISISIPLDSRVVFRDSDWNRDVNSSGNTLELYSDWNSLRQSSISLLMKKTDTLQLSMNNLREALNVLDGEFLLRLKSLALEL